MAFKRKSPHNEADATKRPRQEPANGAHRRGPQETQRNHQGVDPMTARLHPEPTAAGEAPKAASVNETVLESIEIDAGQCKPESCARLASMTPPTFRRSDAPSPPEVDVNFEYRFRCQIYGKPIYSFEEFTNMVGLVVGTETFNPELIWWDGHNSMKDKSDDEGSVSPRSPAPTRPAVSQGKQDNGPDAEQQGPGQRMQQNQPPFHVPTASVFELRFVPVGVNSSSTPSEKPSGTGRSSSETNGSSDTEEPSSTSSFSPDEET